MMLNSRDRRALVLGLCSLLAMLIVYSLYISILSLEAQRQEYNAAFEEYRWLVVHQTELNELSASHFGEVDGLPADTATELAQQLGMSPRFDNGVFKLIDVNSINALNWVNNFTAEGYSFDMLQIRRGVKQNSVDLQASW